MPSMLQPDQQSAAGAGRAARPKMMCAAVFVEPGRIELEDKPIPDVGPLDALLRITTTTICGTDIHILRGEYPVARDYLDSRVATIFGGTTEIMKEIIGRRLARID